MSYRDNQQRGQEVVDEVQQEALRGAQLPLYADGARDFWEEADRRLQEGVRWRVRDAAEGEKARSGEIQERRVQLTLRETLIGQSDLAGQQVEAEAAEDAAERRDGDEAVGGARLADRGTGSQDKRKRRSRFPSLTKKTASLTLTNAAVFLEWFPFITLLVSIASWFTVCVNGRKKKKKNEDAEVWKVHWPERAAAAAAVY